MLSLHKDLWDWDFEDVSSDTYVLKLSLVDSKNKFDSFLKDSIAKVQRRMAKVDFKDVNDIPDIVVVPSQFFNLIKLHLRKPLKDISFSVYSDKRVKILNSDIVDVFFEKQSKDLWKIFIKVEGRYSYGGG